MLEGLDDLEVLAGVGGDAVGFAGGDGVGIDEICADAECECSGF
jgi:hypothetical protein